MMPPARPHRFARTLWRRSRIGRPDLFAVASLFLGAFLFPGWVLFARDSLPGADLPLFHLPFQQYVFEHFRAGVIPFWNPYANGGIPTFGNPEIAPMYPVHLPVLICFGPEIMLKIKYLFHLGLLAAGFHLLLRAFSLPVWAALLGAWTLQISGFPITKITLPNVGDSAAWIPMMLFLNLWFARRPALRRGLLFALAGGCMLLLFFPQITLTLVLLLALAGTARFLKISVVQTRAEKPSPAARRLHRFVLPAAEALLILTLLRHPPRPVYFPEPGWRCAFDGMGKLGIAVLAALPMLWIFWFRAAGLCARFDGRGFRRWAIRFAGVWGFAALFAAPQLAVTGEMIPLSNQAALAYQTDEDFFTGAQAYGSVREFIEQSARAVRKESVNNMALGPAVWALVFAGILAGFHRERRLCFGVCAGVVIVGSVYMAAPGVFDIFRRLPFFWKFAGLSRYLAFLNFFLVLLAVLSAQRIVRLFPSAWKPIAAGLLAVLAIANIALLIRHQNGYWRYLAENPSEEIPSEIAAWLKEHLSENERMLLDLREQHEGSVFVRMMYPFANRLPTLSLFTPMHAQHYSRWERAHNRLFGVDYSDYRAGFLEPSPSPYSRAARVRLFLFAPDTPPLPKPLGPEWELRPLDVFEGWSLYEDPALPPAAWPETDPERELPVFEIPENWRAEVTFAGPHRLEAQVWNPGEETWMVLPFAHYPGWKAWVEDRPAPIRPAYGFLSAARVPSGPCRVRLEYRPRSFALGWLAFLWMAWSWIALWQAGAARGTSGTSPQDPRPSYSGAPLLSRKILTFVFVVAAGIPVALLAGGRVLFTTPDSLLARALECAVVAAAALAAGFATRGFRFTKTRR